MILYKNINKVVYRFWVTYSTLYVGGSSRLVETGSRLPSNRCDYPMYEYVVCVLYVCLYVLSGYFSFAIYNG